jgi:hypothetical protein
MGILLLIAAAAIDIGQSGCLSYYEDRHRPSVDSHIGRYRKPSSGDVLGDVWEMEEVACWRGTWLRRGQSNIFDGYWVHASGERVRATLEMFRNGRSVIVVRRHPGGKYCRYDGTVSDDLTQVEGRYTCTWERTPMAWRATIVRMEQSLPAILRQP